MGYIFKNLDTEQREENCSVNFAEGVNPGNEIFQSMWNTKSQSFPSDFMDDSEFLTLGKLRITGEKLTKDKSESKPPET